MLRASVDFQGEPGGCAASIQPLSKVQPPILDAGMREFMAMFDDNPGLPERLGRALEARQDLRNTLTAIRLYNGFLEGEPRLVVDLYADSLVLHNYANPVQEAEAILEGAREFYQQQLTAIRSVVVKPRNAPPEQRTGLLVAGERPAARIEEYGVRYAIDLLLNRDCSFYLDTRALRRWILENLAGKTVLNTFAYTGSLGVAAIAAGARRVVQLDLNKRFLNLAKTSYTLNGFPINKQDFIAGDFFPQIAQMKRSEQRFDVVFVDPPLFSRTARGTVDLYASERLINKVRPLINDGGHLVMINNAVFLSGAEHHAVLARLAEDGYLQIEQRIDVDPDVSAYQETRRGMPMVDPAPYNHTTKITVLRVRRK